MKDFAESFYKSKDWQRVRTTYFKSVQGLCEPCLEKGIIARAEIIHHKVHINESNINDASITLSFDNLEAVCRECHALRHGAKKKRFKVDEMGRVEVL